MEKKYLDNTNNNFMKKSFLLLMIFMFSFSNGQLLKDLGRALGNEVLRSAEKTMEERAQRKEEEAKRLATEQKEQKKKDDSAKAQETFKNSYLFSPILGLYGCDATALYKDSKNNLWLGTGGSGAVYKYDSDSKIWKLITSPLNGFDVTRIIEIDGYIFAKWDNLKGVNFNKSVIYRIDVLESVKKEQVNYIKSEMESDFKKRKVAIFESLYNDSKMEDIFVDYKYLNDIEKFDDKYYILDSRGLFYIDSDDKKVKKFNSNGLNAMSVYQIIPHKNDLLIWTNALELWKYSNGQWSNSFGLDYDYRIITNGEKKTYFPKIIEVLQEKVKEGSLLKYQRDFGYITVNENNTVALALNGRAFVKSLNNQSYPKMIGNNDYGSPKIYEAIVDDKDILFLGTDRGIYKLENGNDDLVSVDQSIYSKEYGNSFKYFRRIFSADDRGRVFIAGKPQFLDLNNDAKASKKYSHSCSTKYADFNGSKIFGNLMVSNGYEENEGERWKSFRLNPNDRKWKNLEVYTFSWNSSRDEDVSFFQNPYEYKVDFGNGLNNISVYYQDDNTYYVGAEGNGLLKLNVKYVTPYQKINDE